MATTLSSFTGSHPFHHFFFHLKCVAYQLIIFVRQVEAIAHLFTRLQTSQHIECVVINRISWWRKTLLPSNIAKIQILQICLLVCRGSKTQLQVGTNLNDVM